ncbi:MAG: protein TolQ [Burkholderiaceae bacterium]
MCNAYSLTVEDHSVNDLSILHLIAGASVLVKVVMGLLLLMSLASWTIIFRKFFGLASARRATRSFENDFWKDRDLGSLYQQVREGEHAAGPLARIFESGMSEYLKGRQHKDHLDNRTMVDNARRAMRASSQRELDNMESGMGVLATTGSVSPYIGLFGTVWGIMNAFRGLANVEQATLASVAPGIAEALVATAIGLFAAIPAVIAYNRFANNIDRLVSRFDSFVEEFSNILQRQAR